MIKKFFHAMLIRRHFWRFATFDEVAEIYVSRMMRMAALNLVTAFISIYLYQLGHSILFIALMWSCFFGFKSMIALPSARLVGWIGPKHSILISNLLYIPAMILFAYLPTGGDWLLVPTLFLQAISATMYATAYAVNFSKVKSVTHAGKEIAYMNILEKITTGLSPLIGGFIALWWGPQVVIVIAAILFAFAAAPLMRTGEPIRVNQKLSFQGFPWKMLFRHTGAEFALGFDVFSSGAAWTLYIAIVIVGISSESNDIYAITGALTSVVFIAAIVSSYVYGRIVDRRRGGELMKAAAVGKALTHIVRPFVQTPVTVAGLNAVNELATTGYTLPNTRAVYDNADLSGARVAYLGLVELIANFGAACAAATLGMLAMVLTEEMAMKGLFFVAAGVVLLIATARFAIHKKS